MDLSCHRLHRQARAKHPNLWLGQYLQWERCQRTGGNRTCRLTGPARAAPDVRTLRSAEIHEFNRRSPPTLCGPALADVVMSTTFPEKVAGSTHEPAG